MKTLLVTIAIFSLLLLANWASATPAQPKVTASLTETSADATDNARSFSCLDTLTAAHRRQIVNCARAYWTNQAGNRSVDTWAANCFNENMVAASLLLPNTFGKAEVVAGWGQVSTSDADGNPYFEDNLAIEIINEALGCSSDGLPVVQINLDRTLRYWATGEVRVVPYASTFTFIHSSSNGTNPRVGEPDYTISLLQYMPQMLKEVVLWPSQPLADDPIGQNYVCSYLNSACHGMVDWSPQANCWQWMQAHNLSGPAPDYDFSVPTVPYTQFCVYFLAFLNNSPNPRTTYCPALAVCTGNIVDSSKRGEETLWTDAARTYLEQGISTHRVNPYRLLALMRE